MVRILLGYIAVSEFLITLPNCKRAAHRWLLRVTFVSAAYVTPRNAHGTAAANSLNAGEGKTHNAGWCLLNRDQNCCEPANDLAFSGQKAFS